MAAVLCGERIVVPHRHALDCSNRGGCARRYRPPAGAHRRPQEREHDCLGPPRAFPGSQGSMVDRDESFNLEHYPNDHKIKVPEFDRNYTLAGYKAANQVDIWVSMDFKTPGCNGVPNRRRSKVVSSNVTAVKIFDMPNAPSFLGMVKIATLIEPNPREVCHFYRGVLDRWISITSNDTLDYIAQTYGGRSEFTAMLQVDTTTTTNDTTVKTKNDTHYCWPVTIGHSSRSTTAEPLTCKHSRGINYTAGAAVLGPPPPPPPPPPPSSPPPPQICELCGQN